MLTLLRTAAVAAALATATAGVAHGAGTTTQAAPADAGAIDAYVQERMAATDTPGLAYAIVGPDGVRHERAWGDDGDGQPVTANTPFLWGSVSKPVTATAIMTLVEDGQVELDAPVRRYLPWFQLADSAASDAVTIRQLLTHTSGIPDGTGVTDQFDEAGGYRDAVEDLAEVTPHAAPGSGHDYASANYLVLGAVVEEVTGQPYVDYLRQAVLAPAGMSSTITTPAQARDELPPGHRYVAGRPVGMATPFDAAGPSYGYLGGSLHDLAAFASAQLAGRDGGGPLLVSTGSVADMHNGTASVSEDTSYGLGWRDTRSDGVHKVWHGGATPGYQAMVLLLPEHDRAVVLTQNVYGTFQDADLAAVGFGVAQMVAGQQPEPPSGDSLYPMLLGTVAAVALLLLAALVWSLFRIVWPRARPANRPWVLVATALWTATGIALAVLAVAVVPGMFDANLWRIPLYAPDIGWGLMAIALLGGLLVPVRLAVTYRRLRVGTAH